METDKKTDLAVKAGKGAIYITIAKIYFIATGWIMVFVLPRLMSSRLIGIFELVLGAISILDNSIVTGTIQTVSKFTSEKPDKWRQIIRKALKLQFIVGGSIALFYFIFAYPVSHYFLKSDSLTPFMRLTAVVILTYSLYAGLIGSLNGQRRFGSQASLDMTFSTLKMLLVIVLAAVGFKVWGAVGGFVSATVIVMLIAFIIVGAGTPGQDEITSRRYLSFWFPLFFYTLIINLIMRTDLYLLQAITSRIAFHNGMALHTAENLSNTLSAYYSYAQKLAFLPYQIILSITFVAFPLVSSATYSGDMESAQRYIKTAFRFAFILVVGVAIVLFANPSGVIYVILPQEYTAGAFALRILSAGIVCFSIMVVAITILNSSGHIIKALLYGGITLLISVVLNISFLFYAGAGNKAVGAAAIATSCAMFIGALISTLTVYKLFKATIPSKTFIRCLISSSCCFLVGLFIKTNSKIAILIECICIFVLYFVILYLLKEINQDDKNIIRKTIKKS